MRTMRWARAAAPTDTEHEQAPLGWVRFCWGAGSRAALGFGATLLLIATVPMLLGWKAYLVPTGSMKPSISPGDVIVGSSIRKDAELKVGQVVVSDDLSHIGRTHVHRIVEVRADGTFLTRGDANGTPDAQAVSKSGLHALARLRVPLVGLPALWLRDGQLVQLAGFVLALLLALKGATVNLDETQREEKPDSDVDGSGEDLLEGELVWDDGDAADESGRAWWADRPARVGAVASVIAALAAVALPYGAAQAAKFSGTTLTTNTWASARSFYPYPTAVLGNSPALYWLLDETSGTTAADFSGNGSTGTYVTTYTQGQAGGLPNNPGSAVLLGTSGRIVANSSVTNPTAFSLELWFKTTTTTGGKLIGFESTTGATSPTADRHVFIRDNGRIVYGGWGANSRITTPTTKVYNDGVWHHLVVTATGVSGGTQTSSIYVDGALIVSGTTTATSNYTGYWRAGSGTLPTGTTYPTSTSFEGTIDHVAIYNTVLTAAQVAAHYAAR